MLEVKLSNIPKEPGVYLMKNIKNKIIYVGKAKILKNRVKSYFSGTKKDFKTQELVKNVNDIDFITCNNEVEALILENNLIKKYSPKYNILLKDQKTYPYLKITKEELPKISKVRKITDNNAYYFGPYPNLNMKYAMKTLMKVFQIRDCNINVYEKLKRPCLKYDLKLCNAPCVYKDEKTIRDYKNNSEMLIKFLNGKSNEVIEEIKSKMIYFSEELEFEKAIYEREKIKILEKLLENQNIDQKNQINEDIIVYKYIEGKIFYLILNIRNGVVIGKISSHINYSLLENNSIYQSIITNYYEYEYIPNKLILDILKYEESTNYEENNSIEDREILEKWFFFKKEKNVKIKFPKIKSKDKELLELANKNLDIEIRNYYDQKILIFDGLKKLEKVLKLKKFPKRIDCFDISNTQGKEPVAAMTVAINGILTNKLYRLFNIKIKDTPDDFMMLREAVTRRYTDIPIEEVPDLILIDGGKGQLSSVYEILKDNKLLKDTNIISIAKKEEEIFKPNESESYIFEKNDEALRILQRLRDEAHRFGITHHRKRRGKRVLTDSLDEISGIGKKTKKKLLDRFHTFKNIKNATYEELREIVSDKIAKKILEN